MLYSYSLTATKSPNASILGGISEGAGNSLKPLVQMNTVQNYAQSTGGATPFEPTAQTLQQQLETLQNVVLTLDNPTFRLKYSYLATSSEQQLSQALARVIGEIDPLLVEALT